MLIPYKKLEIVRFCIQSHKATKLIIFDTQILFARLIFF